MKTRILKIRKRKINYLDLFAGIGGFALAAQWANLQFDRHYYSEIDNYACKVYAKHFPKAISLGDITKIKWENLFNNNDEWFVTGGFPCQSFSTASHQKKTAKDLWKYQLRAIKKIKPKYMIAENVRRMPIEKAQKDMDKLGFKTITKNFGANEIGADHKRNRWWIIAHTDNQDEFFSRFNAEMEKLSTMAKTMWGWKNYSRATRIYNGISPRMDRFRCLGNSIMPQCAYLIFKSLCLTHNKPVVM